MNNQTLNYTDNNGNTITAERYFISDDPKPKNDIPIEPVRSFQTHCECCGAPVDLDAVKCPYCGVAYWFKRGSDVKLEFMMTRGNMSFLLTE